MFLDTLNVAHATVGRDTRWNHWFSWFGPVRLFWETSAGAAIFDGKEISFRSGSARNGIYRTFAFNTVPTNRQIARRCRFLRLTMIISLKNSFGHHRNASSRVIFSASPNDHTRDLRLVEALCAVGTYRLWVLHRFLRIKKIWTIVTALEKSFWWPYFNDILRTPRGRFLAIRKNMTWAFCHVLGINLP